MFTTTPYLLFFFSEKLNSFFGVLLSFFGVLLSFFGVLLSSFCIRTSFSFSVELEIVIFSQFLSYFLKVSPSNTSASLILIKNLSLVYSFSKKRAIKSESSFSACSLIKFLSKMPSCDTNLESCTNTEPRIFCVISIEEMEYNLSIFSSHLQIYW